jgi:L-amino acid N-acyltransferase YncA
MSPDPHAVGASERCYSTRWSRKPSAAATTSAGFEEVGIQRRHGRLDGEWRDCVLVERLLGPASD